MSLLDPALLTRLKRTRLVTRTAFPASGIGERQSRNKGAGLEFEDYREYQPGDDVRTLTFTPGWGRTSFASLR